MKQHILQYFTVFIMSIGLLVTKSVWAQVNVQDSVISTFVIHVSYAYQFPGGDMADRYGNNSTIGTAVSYKTDENWLWTAEINFIFSPNVKNSGSIISEITTDDGFVIGLDGLYANIRPLERGFTLLGRLGKVIPMFHMNPNSGVLLDFGAGYIQHKIRWDVENNSAPQLGGDYKKGYDRFTEGFSLSQSAGLFYMGDQRLWNFKISAEVVEAFTKSKRYNFDTFGGEASTRLDLFFGLKVSWMIPLYGRPPKAMYFY